MLDPTDGGEPREIDILIEHKVGPHQVRIAIECRGHARRQGLEWIESLVGRYEHLPVHKVIAVSRSGFTRSASRAASHANIDIVTLAEALAADWPGEVARFKAGFVLWRHPITAAEVNYHDGPKLTLTRAQLLEAKVHDATGNVLGTFEDDIKHLFTTFASEDVRKWTHENAKELYSKPAGTVWPVRLAYVAHNRYLVPPDGPRRRIKAVTLSLDCSYRFEPTPLEYHRYHNVLVGSGVVTPLGQESSYRVSLLFGPDGKPKALNVRNEGSGSNKRAV